MVTEIKPINEKSLQSAKDILINGGVVGMPTETVYGLAANGFDPNAVKKIFVVKGRPSDNPLICHVHKDYDISALVNVTKPYALDLIKEFTPGPLTLVFESKGAICKEAVGGGDTLAIRFPSHAGCQEFLRYVNLPIVAPSANISKHTSPVTAKHVYDDLNGLIPLILDGGKCTGGIESTVLDATGDVPRILRAGLVTKEMIESVVGECEIAEHKEGDRVKSPGVKYKHYRPKCQTAMFNEDELDKVKEAYENCVKDGKTPYVMCSDKVAREFEGYNILNLGKTSEDVASNLYDKLLEGEKQADLIIAVALPDEKGVNMGIMNRMKKSCG